MAKQEGIEIEGVVTEVLPDRNFRVLLDNGHTILAYAAGKMSKHKIRVLVGDRVSVETIKAAAKFLCEEIRFDVASPDLSLQMSKLPPLPRDRFLIRNVRV